MTRFTTWLAGLALFLGMVPGCGPKLKPDELGRVVYDPSEVPGADAPYPMPELGKAEDLEPSPEFGQPMPGP